MMLYFQNPGQSSEFVIDGADYDLQRTVDNDHVDELVFRSVIGHIRRGARIRAVSDSGDIQFLGVVTSIEYNVAGGLIRYVCAPAEELLSYRSPPPIRYPGGVGLVLSDIFSSDPPSQAVGANRYCMGLLWLLRSFVAVGADRGIVSWDADGIGRLTGWKSKVTGHDIYYGGRLLASSTPAEIGGETNRYALEGDDLLVRGTGAGDRYDVIAADGWLEPWVRLGDIDDDAEIENAYEVGELDTWSLIRDLAAETGQYIHIRREADAVYLDISESPSGRGSVEEPYASLEPIGDFEIRKLLPARHLRPSCVIGCGANGERIEGVRVGVGGPTPPTEAWIDAMYSLSEARLPPFGRLDEATTDIFGELRQCPPMEIDLYRDDLLVGDFLEIDRGQGLRFVGQIQSINYKPNGYPIAVVGAPDLNLRTAFWERVEGASIEAYRQGDIHSTTFSSGPTSNISVVRGLFDKKVHISNNSFHNAITLGDGIVVMPEYNKKIFKSDDWGATWRTVYDSATYPGLRSIAKWDDDNLIVGAVNGHFLISSDGGENWTYKGTAAGISINVSLATFPGGIAIAGSDAGKIYRSTNYGANWTEVYSTGQGHVRKIKTWPNGYCLAATDNGGRVYRSTDYGVNWTQVFNTGVNLCRGLETWGDGRALLGGGTPARIWRTTNYGANWTQVYASGFGSDYYIGSLGIDEHTGVAFAGKKNGTTQTNFLNCEDINATTMKWVISDTESAGNQDPNVMIVWPNNPIVTLMVLNTSSDIYIYNTDVYVISFLLSYTTTIYDFHGDEQKLLSLNISVTDVDCAEDATAVAMFEVNTKKYITRFVPAYGNVITDMDISPSWIDDGTNLIRVTIYAKGFQVYGVNASGGYIGPPLSLTVTGISKK